MVRKGLFRRKRHTDVNNGRARWTKGRRKLGKVVCVDNYKSWAVI